MTGQPVQEQDLNNKPMKGNMTDENLKELEAEEARLWAVCNQADEASKKANSEWCAVHTLRKHELLRREIMAQIQAENKPQEEKV